MIKLQVELVLTVVCLFLVYGIATSNSTPASAESEIESIYAFKPMDLGPREEIQTVNITPLQEYIANAEPQNVQKLQKLAQNEANRLFQEASYQPLK